MKIVFPNTAFYSSAPGTLVRALGLIVLGYIATVSATAQKAHEGHDASATNAVAGRINPHGRETDTVAETLAKQPPEPVGLYPRKDSPPPVEDRMKHFFFLADTLEYRPAGKESDLFWDIESWYGGDFNRIWAKTEGTKSTAQSDYDLDLQLLYGRFIKKYYDFQVGLRGEAREFENRNQTRAQAVIGLEGLVPYRFEIEPLLFISQEGDISFRFTGTRDVLLTQRLVFQGRFETKLAVQEVKEFATGSGLNSIEVGLRLRYEIRREFAPYIGVSYDQSFFGTEDLLRAEGRNASQVRFVTGLRIWF